MPPPSPRVRWAPRADVPLRTRAGSRALAGVAETRPVSRLAREGRGPTSKKCPIDRAPPHGHHRNRPRRRDPDHGAPPRRFQGELVAGPSTKARPARESTAASIHAPSSWGEAGQGIAAPGMSTPKSPSSAHTSRCTTCVLDVRARRHGGCKARRARGKCGSGGFATSASASARGPAQSVTYWLSQAP